MGGRQDQTRPQRWGGAVEGKAHLGMLLQFLLLLLLALLLLAAVGWGLGCGRPCGASRCAR